MICKCAYCIENKRLLDVIETGSKEQLIHEIKRLKDDLDHVQLDNNVNDAILDGTWPRAASYALRILENCKFPVSILMDISEEIRKRK